MHKCGHSSNQPGHTNHDSKQEIESHLAFENSRLAHSLCKICCVEYQGMHFVDHSAYTKLFALCLLKSHTEIILKPNLIRPISNGIYGGNSSFKTACQKKEFVFFSECGWPLVAVRYSVPSKPRTSKFKVQSCMLKHLT
jgi:hypothetical protein